MSGGRVVGIKLLACCASRRFLQRRAQLGNAACAGGGKRYMCNHILRAEKTPSPATHSDLGLRGTMVERRDLISLAVAVGVPLIGGQVAALFSSKGLLGWYKRIRKPKWTPPNPVFGIVWPLLYVGQGVSSWLVWKKGLGQERRLPLTLYGIQLVLNLIWQPIMFSAHRPDIALADSAAMLGVATAATVTMARNAGDKGKVVVGLMSPYVAWLAFATALTANIWKNNPNADKVSDEPIIDKDSKKAGEAAGKVAGKAAQAAVATGAAAQKH